MTGMLASKKDVNMGEERVEDRYNFIILYNVALYSDLNKFLFVTFLYWLTFLEGSATIHISDTTFINLTPRPKKDNLIMVKNNYFLFSILV